MCVCLSYNFKQVALNVAFNTYMGRENKVGEVHLHGYIKPDLDGETGK